MQRRHFTVCAVCSACVTINEGFIPPYSILFYFYINKERPSDVTAKTDVTMFNTNTKQLVKWGSPVCSQEVSFDYRINTLVTGVLCQIL